ncbi:MAG: hypothetical protein ACYC1C_19900 [Chloroflexota bacterium]
MRQSVKILSVTLGVMLLLGVLGVGAAFAQTPAPTTATDWQSAFLGKVATILGVDEQKLTDAFTQARSETIDEAVQAGQMTQAQADWMKQRVEQAQQDGFGPGVGGPMMRGGRGGHMGGQFGGPWAQQAPAPTQ